MRVGRRRRETVKGGRVMGMEVVDGIKEALAFTS